MAWVRNYIEAGHILELGCATGEFLVAASEAGFDCEGIEPSPGAAEAAREISGKPVLNGTLADWCASARSRDVDAVAAFHVLEHTATPGDLLRDLRQVLRPGGFLFLEVPNFSARDARRQGSRWHMAAVEEHWIHFTPSSLERALRKAGFERSSLEILDLEEYVQSRLRWKLIRARSILRGNVTASKDLLRVVARNPG